jgi:hypothetical protein
MLKRLWILLPVILLCLVLGAKEVPREASSQTQGRPNILLVLTDDQDVGSVSEMPNVQSQLVDRGTTYDRAFVTTPCAALRGPPSCAASTPTTTGSGTTRPQRVASSASRSSASKSPRWRRG